MKANAQRILALVLVFVLCISLMPANLAAAVQYITGSTEDYSNVIINWGQRGTASTYLSDHAETFYQTYSTSYEVLSKNPGAAVAEDVPNSALYKQLQALMASAHHTCTTYGETRYLYQYTDCQNSDPSSISSFYSGISVGAEWDGGNTWNREHTWPDSKGLNGDDENDIMMLRPTSKSENSGRSNRAYGESAGFYDPNRESGGAYDVRGDVARIMLYTYVRWGNTQKMWGIDGVIESVEVLLSWMEEDPVDTWEMGRNDSVESITGTRNVFVDYPELAFLLFAAEIPSDMTTPSGIASNPSGYQIQAVSSNAAHGTVSVSGSTVNAFPAEGYAVSGYTLLSGTADVVRSGNSFIVSASSDCELRVDFEKRVSASVTYVENGSAIATVEAYEGDSVVLPTHSGAVPNGYSFLGWITESLDETTAAPATVYVPGSSYRVSADISLYALYSRVDLEGTGTTSVFELYTGEVVEGDYLVVTDGGAMKAEVSSAGRLNFTNVMVYNDAVENPDADIIWHVGITSDGYYTLYNEETASYAGGTGSKNKAGLLNAVTDYAKWSVSGSPVYTFVNLGNHNKGVNDTLIRNADFGYACYSNGYKPGVNLYKSVSGTVYYSTATQPCDHANAQPVPGQEPGCTQIGYTAGIYCNDCSSYISGHEPLAALGHSYHTVVTEPTATEQGYTTYTCEICGDTKVGDYTEPLGETYTVSFSVPEGVEYVSDMACNNRGILLPEAGIPAGERVYTFAGWAEEGIQNSEAAPALYTSGTVYTARKDVILYAVYTYTIGGTGGTGDWLLVTKEADLHSGAQLVLASAESGVAAGRITSQYMSSVEASFSEDGTVLTQLPEEAVVLTLDGNTGAWTLTNSDGQLLGATAVKKLAWDKGEATWTISISDGLATITSAADGYGRFLYNVKSPRFTTYTSDTNVSMLLPQLYIQDLGTGTVYYTSVIGSECAHNGQTELRNVMEPNYLEDGYSGDLYCLQCGELLEEGRAVSNNPFTDVRSGNRFKTAILWAYYEGITSGKTASTFAPGEAVSRAQFVMLLWRAVGEPEPASQINPFTDISPNNRFYRAILWAYYAGITSGKTDTTFCPNDTCTRSQIVAFLYRHAGSPELNNPVNPFEDVREGNRFYTAILWAYTNGITSGKTETTFDVNGLCAREHVVAFLYKYLGD